MAGVLIGAVSGGATGGYVATHQGDILPSAAGNTLAPIPSAQTVRAGGSGTDQVVDVVNQLLPSVVTVINKLPNGRTQSSGSGFVIDAARGYIVTNNHVVENVRDKNPGASFDVIFSDARTEAAKLIGRDPLTDVAVLQVGARGLRVADLGNSDEAPVGATVVAIGSALGEFQNTVTTGVISAKGRRVPENDQIVLEDLIQTDAAINEGNSGGPLILAATKQVVGMNTLVNRENAAQGLGFSISSNTVRQIANELIQNGRVVRGYIGISYSQLSAREAQAMGLPVGTTGITITDVQSGSAGAQAGLHAKDVITKINDQQIDALHPLLSVMVKFRPGDHVTLTVFREGSAQSIPVTLDRQP